jgi:hypothetical protein
MMRRYYWLEWFGAWGLWVVESSGFRRCLARVHLEDNGEWWRADRVDSHAREDRKFLGRTKDLERAKAICAIEVRFPEGESK